MLSGAILGVKFLVSVVFLALLFGIRAAIAAALRRRTPAPVGEQRQERRRFWIRQAVQIAVFALLLTGLWTIWIDDPSRFTTIAGLATAGLAVALQRVVTSLAAYLIILRGRVFTVIMSINYAVYGVGVLVAGPLTDSFGARWVYGAVGALLAFASLIAYGLGREKIPERTPEVEAA